MAVALAVAIVWLGFDFAIPFLPLYVRELGLTSTAEVAFWSGLLIAMGPGLGSLTSPFWGMMADRYGAKPMMLRSLAVFTVLLGLCGAVTAFWQLFVVRFGLGVLGGFAPLAFATLLTAGPRSRASQALGVLQAAQFLPLALGPALGGLIADRFGLRVNFYLGSALCLAALLVVAVLLRNPAPRAVAPAAGERPKPAHFLDQLRSAGFALPLGLLFIAYFVDRSFLPVLPLYVAQLGAPPELVASSAGLALALGAIGNAVSGPVLGRLAGRYPLTTLLTCTLAFGVLLCALIALVGDVVQFVALRTALALLAGGLPTLGFTMGAQAAARGSLGRQTGWLTSATQLASAGGPLLAGLIAAWSIQAVFLVDAILLALSLLAVGVVSRRWPALDAERGRPA